MTDGPIHALLPKLPEIRRLRDAGCDIGIIARLVLLREDDVRATIRYLDVTDALGFEARWI